MEYAKGTSITMINQTRITATKMIFAILLLSLLSQPVHAQSTQSNPDVKNTVLLPLISTSYIPTCAFWGNPIWLDVWLSINTPPNGNNIYGLFTGTPGVDGVLLNMYDDTGVFWLGESDSLNYPLQVYEFDSRVNPNDRTYTLRCSLSSQPQPPQSTQVVGSSVDENGTTWFDYAIVYAEDDLPLNKRYTVACAFYGDTQLKVVGSIYNQAEHSLRSFTWYEDKAPIIIGYRSCSGATDYVIDNPDESLVVVTITTEDDNVVIYENDFYRFRSGLPVILYMK